MRDTKRKWREEVESLFDTFKDRQDFWSILRHHDIYGCLCTGEASIPALADIIGWTYSEQETANNKSTMAYLSHLLWLNISDTHAALIDILGGITTVEIVRYLKDWQTFYNILMENNAPRNLKRNHLKEQFIEIAGMPERTIERITRIVATCYRKEMRLIAPEDEIKSLVEKELCDLHGTRLAGFSYKFAHFCKIDYGLRFFYLLMQMCLIDSELMTCTNDDTGVPQNCSPTEDKEIIEKERPEALHKMIQFTCQLLRRIVDDYGNLIADDKRSTPLLGISMSGLMLPPQIGWSICQTLKERPSSALNWIADEISIWL
ncbi:MAG: hypothetical protein GY765_27785, partial [bacterium]|nr:hypothetical protein [bacterium]